MRALIYISLLLLTLSCCPQRHIIVTDTLRVSVPVEIPETEINFSDSSVIGMFTGDFIEKSNDTVKVVVYRDTFKYKIKVSYKDVIRIDTLIKVDTIIKVKKENCQEIKGTKKTFYEKTKSLLFLIFLLLIVLLISKLTRKR